MPMPPLLIIVQDCETQFDAPLYAYLEQQGGLALQVYYTQTLAGATGPVDPEIGQAPRWDHLCDVQYSHVHFPAHDLRGAIALSREIVARRPTHVIVSGYFPPSHLWLALLLRRAGLAIGLRSDNTLEHSRFQGLKGLVKRLVLPRILRRYHTWHPVGSAAELYLEAIARTRRPLFRFPYAPDNDWFARESAPWRAQRSDWRLAQGWGTDDFVVLGVLKWHPREDPLTLVRAFIDLRRAFPAARLVLVGDGPLRDEIESGLMMHREAVHLPGYVSYRDLPCWYGVADVFVHPAHSEPWGVSVNEAMACGLPVIASDGVGARHDLIEVGVTGDVYPVGDVQGLAERLAAWASAPERRAAMGRAARAKVADWGYAGTREAMLDAIDHSRAPESAP